MKTLFKKQVIHILALIFMSNTLLAQDNFTIKMSIKTEGLPAEMAAYGEQDMVTQIKGDKLKTEVSSMMFSRLTFVDGDKVTQLFDAMGNKSGYNTTRQEMEESMGNEPTEKPKIVYSDETKIIAGYECKKVVITTVTKDKQELVTTAWITDKIVNKHKYIGKANGRGMADLSDLNGFPLALEMPMNYMGNQAKLVMNTTEVSTAAIDDAAFTPNTDGYKIMSYKEFREHQKMMQQQGR